MHTMLDQYDIRSKMTCSARDAGDLPAALSNPHVRPPHWPRLSLTGSLVAGRLLFIEPKWVALGRYLLASTGPLSFCSGICGLAISSAFESAVPRWFILGYGGACVLLTLLAPSLTGSWHFQTSGQPEYGSQMGKDATAQWTTGIKPMTRFSCGDARPAVVCRAGRASSVRAGPPPGRGHATRGSLSRDSQPSINKREASVTTPNADFRC